MLLLNIAKSKNHQLLQLKRCSTSTSNKLIVFGGNGYVGQRVCRSGLKLGMEVISVNRSGPPQIDGAWKNSVKWVMGDVAVLGEWTSELKDASGAISCIGAFGSNEVLDSLIIFDT